MKTIEEFAFEYSCKWPKAEPRIERAVIAGANHVMSLPLADRLTAEERKEIKATYDFHLKAVGDCYTHSFIRAELERIFGKSMFEEEGGDK